MKDGPIILCEGEPDVLCGISQGLSCITQTAGAGSWDASFSKEFKGRDVIMVYDRDKAGQHGADKLLNELHGVTAKVEVVEWPEFMEDGQDLTDWFVTHKRTVQDFMSLPRRGWASGIQWEKIVPLEDYTLPEMEPLPGLLGEMAKAVVKASETPIELATGIELATIAAAC